MIEGEGDHPATYPCVCCGYLAFAEEPNSHQFCPICWWEDDVSQLRWPTTSGANRPSLLEAQQNYAATGASSSARGTRARPPLPGERREAGWRPIDPARDDFESAGVQERPWPDDRTVLYWWRDTFWRRASPAPEGRTR